MDKRTLEITLKQAKEWFKGDNEVLKNLALQTFTENELQEIPRVKSWEEFCEKNRKVDCEYYINTGSQIHTCIGSFRDSGGDRNLLATKEDAEAVLALIQLKRLRDQWWESINWKPGYTDYKHNNYTIIKFNDEIIIDAVFKFYSFLIFPTREIAEDFLNCFRDLIEKAKELL